MYLGYLSFSFANKSKNLFSFIFFRIRLLQNVGKGKGSVYFPNALTQQQDVPRLDVAVDQKVLVDELQGTGDLKDTALHSTLWDTYLGAEEWCVVCVNNIKPTLPIMQCAPTQ